MTDLVPFGRGRASRDADAAAPITYDGSADGDPTWDTLPEAVLDCTRRSNVGLGSERASLVTPAVVRRDRNGAERISVLAWRLEDGDRLWVLEAARAVDADSSNRRRARGDWSVRVAAVGDVRVQRASMRPVPRPQEDDSATAGASAAPSVPPGYGGRVPEVWANLPLTVRDAMDAAVPLDRARIEHGAARLWYVGTPAGTQVLEKVWYDRHGAGSITGAFIARSVPSALSSMDPDVMRRAVFDAPWDVAAFRAPLDWRAGVALDKRGRTPLPDGIPPRALPPA